MLLIFLAIPLIVVGPSQTSGYAAFLMAEIH